MAHSMRLGVVAEGVETVEQLQFLREHGCDEIQGYYFSKPLPAVEIARFLQTYVPMQTLAKSGQWTPKVAARLPASRGR
jgi:EAL domain-containing protein (putative c-di-GMP-specific phosphodiesterase class I)